MGLLEDNRKLQQEVAKLLRIMKEKDEDWERKLKLLANENTRLVTMFYDIKAKLQRDGFK